MKNNQILPAPRKGQKTWDKSSIYHRKQLLPDRHTSLQKPGSPTRPGNRKLPFPDYSRKPTGWQQLPSAWHHSDKQSNQQGFQVFLSSSGQTTFLPYWFLHSRVFAHFETENPHIPVFSRGATHGGE